MLYILIFLVCCLIREQLPFLQSWKSLSYYFFKYFFSVISSTFFHFPGFTVEHMLQPLHLSYMFCTIYPFVLWAFSWVNFPGPSLNSLLNLCFNYIQLCLPFLTYLNTVIYSQWFLINPSFIRHNFWGGVWVLLFYVYFFKFELVFYLIEHFKHIAKHLLVP